MLPITDRCWYNDTFFNFVYVSTVHTSFHLNKHVMMVCKAVFDEASKSCIFFYLSIYSFL